MLRIGTALCFWGWAWQHLRWDVPYREILWSPDRFGWIVSLFAVEWEAYAGNAANDASIQGFIHGMGYVYLIFGLLALTVHRNRWGQITGLLIGCLCLLLIAYLCYLDKMLKLGQFIEYGSQVLSPLILVLALQRGLRSELVLGIVRVAIICTFAGHGLYAIGFYEMPGHFITMTMKILQVSQPAAENILRIAGALDFLICGAMFHPMLRKPALIYAAIWGLLTALARVWTGFSFEYAYWGLDQSLHQTILRMPHAILPLYLVLALRGAEQAKENPEADSLTPSTAPVPAKS